MSIKHSSLFKTLIILFVLTSFSSCNKGGRYPLDGTTWVRTGSGSVSGYGDWVETQTIKFQKTTFNWIWVETVNGNTRHNTVTSGTYDYKEPTVTFFFTDDDVDLDHVEGIIRGDVLSFGDGNDSAFFIKQ